MYTLRYNRNEILKEVEAMQATTFCGNVVELVYEVTNTYINNVNNSVMKKCMVFGRFGYYVVNNLSEAS